jgi:hypothetical protein
MRIPSVLVCGLFLLGFNSCKEDKKVPDYVWEEDHFVKVLTEFQLAESIVRLGYHRGADSMYYNDSVYQAAFRKMKVTKTAFDSNYNYYLTQPVQLERIYEQVITELSKRTAEFEAKHTQVDSLK